MPNKDGTGPGGKGPKTGRGLGPCKGDSKDLPARKNGRGVGGGQGRRGGRRGNR